MDNQHKKIKGYRDLTQEEIDTMNMIKAKGQELSELCDHINRVPGIDKRWAALGKTHLQEGVMFLVRAVAKPDSF